MYECNRKERFKCLQINKKEDYENLIDIEEVKILLNFYYTKPNAKWMIKSDNGNIYPFQIVPGDWIVFEYDHYEMIPFKIFPNSYFHEEFSIIKEDESCFNV